MSSFETSKGEFESCFAGGLDISEFDNTTTKKPAKSAAAELLRVKALEKEQREKEQAEEEQLEIAIQKRVSTLEQALLAKQKTNSGSVVADALVKMHGHDKSEPLYRSKKFGKRRSGHNRTSTSSKSHFAKKSRPIKHSR
jgi:restriction endonuclease Mrr